MDVRCVVCGEPWDSYGVRNGDMLRWEADLFKKGAGCPCCEGVKPEGMTENDEDDLLFDRMVMNPDEDGDLDLIDTVINRTRPVWERPEPEVLKTCKGCDARLVRNPDDDSIEAEGGSSNQYGYDISDPSNWCEVSGNSYCNNCQTICMDCNNTVVTNDDEIGPYDEGWCHHGGVYGNQHRCRECYDDWQNELHQEAIRETSLPVGAAYADAIPENWVIEAQSEVEPWNTDSDGSVYVRDSDVFAYLCKQEWLVCGECNEALTIGQLHKGERRWIVNSDLHKCSSVYEKLGDINPAE